MKSPVPRFDDEGEPTAGEPAATLKQLGYIE
jgi:hypothetical protein